MLSPGNQGVAEIVDVTHKSWKHHIASWTRSRWIPLTVFCGTFLLFSPVLRNHLVNWDDTDNILFNENFRGFQWEKLKWMWTSFHLGPYQPLSWMSLSVDYLIWGKNSEGDLISTGFFLTNILLHSLNVLLVYCIACRLLRFARMPVSSDRFDGDTLAVTTSTDRTLKLCAAFGAFLFGWHPLRAESVAWATERRDVLSVAFLLGSLVWYLRMVEADARGAAGASQRRRAFHISWLLYVASLLSKAMGMTLPVVLLILDIYPLRRLPADPRDWFRTVESRQNVWRRLREKIPFFIASACCMAVALYGQRYFAGLRRGDYPVSARLAQCAYSLAWYCWKTVWPTGLCTLYPLEVNPDPRDPQFWGSGVAVAIVLLILWLLRHRLPSALAAACAYLVMISPVSGLAQSGPQLVADRYSYLPNIPWAILAAGALLWWLIPPTATSEFEEEPHPWRFRIARGSVLVLLVALGGMTLWQLTFWTNSAALWKRVLAVSDFNPIAHHNYALVIGDKGHMEESFAHLQKAIDQRPSYADAYRNRGILLREEGRYEEALIDLRRACELTPTHDVAHYNLALVLAALGKDDEADTELQTAIELNPGQEKPYRDGMTAVRAERNAKDASSTS